MPQDIIDQSARMGKLHTVLPFNTLGLLRFDGMDGVNECFEYHVEAASETPDLDLDALLGSHMTVELETLAGDPEFFDGVVTEAAWAGEGDTGNAYRFTLRPWFWVMSRRFNNKIFQNKTFEQIIQEICQEFSSDSASGLRLEISGSYEAQEYIVQFAESDFTFLSRLMERYGINYYFEHELGSHQLVLSDATEGFGEVASGSLRYHPSEGQHVYHEEHFWDWTPHRRLVTGKYASIDYNFKTPAASMNVDQEGDALHEYGKIESYEYPGVFLDQTEGKRYAKLRTEQFRARDKHHIARGDALSLRSGRRFMLTGEHQSPELTDQKYLCTRAMHSFSTGGYRAGGEGGEHVFVGNYELVPTAVPYAPERKTPEKKMSGPQTAVVTGAEREDIDVDEYGRITCQFHWDRIGQRDQNSSMRIRVAQPWAGAGWGTLFIPRIGMEVIVEFIDGDPNKPLVTGCVYNNDNMPPYTQPDDKNWNGIKSNSTIGGGGYNELVFNDTVGDELFRQHAQYDMETKVLHDERREIDNDRSTIIGNDETRHVKNDRSTEIDGDESLKVKKARDVTIDLSDKLVAMQDIEIESKTKITLKVGSSSIVMDGQSITLKALNIEAKASVQLKTNGGAMAEHEAGGVMTIKGAVVKIN